MNDCIEEVREHMLAAIELLQEEIKHAPDAATRSEEHTSELQYANESRMPSSA